MVRRLPACSRRWMRTTLSQSPAQSMLNGSALRVDAALQGFDDGWAGVNLVEPLDALHPVRGFCVDIHHLVADHIDADEVVDRFRVIWSNASLTRTCTYVVCTAKVVLLDDRPPHPPLTVEQRAGGQAPDGGHPRAVIRSTFRFRTAKPSASRRR